MIVAIAQARLVVPVAVAVVRLDDIPDIPCACHDPDACDDAGRCVVRRVRLDDMPDRPVADDDRGR